MTNNLYTNIAAIKNKFDKLIKFIKEQSVECATAKVIDLFSDAVKVENHINQAYYQEDSTTSIFQIQMEYILRFLVEKVISSAVVMYTMVLI